jgi:hypothetical protein
MTTPPVHQAQGDWDCLLVRQHFKLRYHRPIFDVMKVGILKLAALVVYIILPAPTTFALGQNAILQNIEAQTFLARHRATEYQRRVAEQNAKAFFKQLTPAKKQELKKKKINAVLISTVPSPKTSPKAKVVKMRYSLDGETLLDDYTYEFETPLQGGTVVKAQGLEPQYVGL